MCTGNTKPPPPKKNRAKRPSETVGGVEFGLQALGQLATLVLVVPPIHARREAAGLRGFALDDDELAQHKGGGGCGVFGGQLDGIGGVVALLMGEKAVLLAHGLAQDGVVPFGFGAAVGGGGDAAQNGVVSTEDGGEQRRQRRLGMVALSDVLLFRLLLRFGRQPEMYRPLCSFSRLYSVGA